MSSRNQSGRFPLPSFSTVIDFSAPKFLLGIVTKNTLGGLLHILLVIAIVFLLIGVIRGRGF